MVQRTIKFYHEVGEYGCFSNFSPHPLLLGGKSWPTTEHYFQAQKFVGTPMEEEIRNAKSPAKAKALGQTRRVKLREDWEQVKDDVMRDVVRAKFTQHTHILSILLGTGDALIVEHTANDSYWGDGGDGHGKNMLGKIIMQVRDELKSKEDTQ